MKRLWVDPALEGAARHLGLGSLELATGDRQPEAVALDDVTGWERRRLDAAGRALPACHLRFTNRLGPDDAGTV